MTDFGWKGSRLARVYSRIMTIGDLHLPYEHRDALKFACRMRDKHDPDLVVFMGDEVDGQGWKFHDSDPDLPGAGREMQLATERVAEWKSAFPKALILHSNHGSLYHRQLLKAGVPRQGWKEYCELWSIDRRWKWVYDIVVKTPLGEVYMHHGKKTNGLLLTKQEMKNSVQGHYHTKCKIERMAHSTGEGWAMQVGCLIDEHSLAMRYGKPFAERPALGSGVIIDGHPRLHRMTLDSNGRWDGNLR